MSHEMLREPKSNDFRVKKIVTEAYTSRNWCEPCNSKHFQNDFNNWTVKGEFGTIHYTRWTELMNGILKINNGKDMESIGIFKEFKNKFSNWKLETNIMK
ncbi:hypothetical protein Glove_410g65 [Diversispora epigaea]|uniref:Uncharacterized protein n=1 Tax=Diversispora epigaea TaxID=1348612 RepID=A0A397H638_9GLOM|nr:hypothetical protein Glove_410g65 [Diversispora epigaea]